MSAEPPKAVLSVDQNWTAVAVEHSSSPKDVHHRPALKGPVAPELANRTDM